MIFSLEISINEPIEPVLFAYGFNRMAAYNIENQILKSIESVLNKTYTDFELLICDDGSTDSASDIIHEYPDHRIRCIRSEANRGVSFARNACLEVCRGDFIAILDADDVWDSKKLEL